MKIVPTAISDVKVLHPTIHGDSRGCFFEAYNDQWIEDLAGRKVYFVQDNHSRSSRGVLRGLHYQVNHVQAKLVRVVTGEVFDVAVDLRESSPTCGKWVAELLSSENHLQLWIPEGFAHGFLALSDIAEVVYKVSDYYSPTDERCIIWNDTDLHISWPNNGEPLLSEKDRAGHPFRESTLYP